jgi:hypothetical protein
MYVYCFSVQNFYSFAKCLEAVIFIDDILYFFKNCVPCKPINNGKLFIKLVN